MISLLQLIFITILSGSLGSGGKVELNEATIFKNGKSETTTLSEAIQFLQLSNIEKLEERIKKLKLENEELKEEHKEEVKNLEIERKKSVDNIEDKIKKAKQSNNNQEMLVGFMRDLVAIDNAKLHNCMSKMQTQDVELTVLSEERQEYQRKNEMNLKNSFKQVELIKILENEKSALKDTYNTRNSQVGNTFIDPEIENAEEFPQYAKFLTKTLADQADKINRMSEQMEVDDKVEERMQLILEELEGLNFTFTSDSSHWGLLDKYQVIVTQQASSLAALGPALTSLVEIGARKYDYQMNTEGKVLDVTPCQCIPKIDQAGVTPSHLSFSCPPGTVSSTSLQATLNLECPDGLCPPDLADAQCGDFHAMPWSDWKPCLGSANECLVNSYRTRKVRNDSGGISEETELQGLSRNPLIYIASTVAPNTKTNVTMIHSDENYPFSLYLPAGLRLGIFLVGGGGGADDSYSGSSGFFEYEEWTVPQDKLYDFFLTLGSGGDYSSGAPTTLAISQPKDQREYGNFWSLTANGGGNSRGQGWSGGSSELGGWNGGNGQDEYNGNGNSLPAPCSPLVSLSPGQTGTYDSDGTGGGGVIVNDIKPDKRWKRDGEGFGAGGGEDNYDGYAGVAVIMVCQ